MKSIVGDPKKLSLDEYFPLFQFNSYSTVINYDSKPVVRILEADGFCVPSIKTTKGYMYVSYQYLLMDFFIDKFRAHLDKDKEMYFNYGTAISNLITARNIYLTSKKLPVINSSVFGEFKVGCVGSTASYTRVSQLRNFERFQKGKNPFRYTLNSSFLNPKNHKINLILLNTILKILLEIK